MQSCRILLDEIRIPNDKGIEIAQSIRNGTARLVSDGSFFPEHKAGSSAFILTAGSSKKNKFVGMNWSPGTKEEQNSYRSELAGIDGGLSMIVVILKFFDITEGGIEIALDGKSTLNSAKASSKFLNIFQSSYHLLQDIRNRLTAIPEGINIKWRWVESH